MFQSIIFLILNSITFMVLNTEMTAAIHFHIILLVLCSITFVVSDSIILLVQFLPQERKNVKITGQKKKVQGRMERKRGRGWEVKRKQKYHLVGTV